MPSEKVLQQKQVLVSTLSDKLKGAVAGVLVDYKGISVADDTRLRRELREAGVEYCVIKNTLIERAAEQAGYHDLKQCLSGTTAVALSAEDPVIAAKILCRYAETSKGKFAIKAGFVEGGF
ncbi:MAG: 50S ribosomal protein L10, partial [Oscillospiraceae bacterium]